MKARLILAVAALALIAACGGPEEQEKGSISVSPVSVNATAEKGSYDIQVNANKHWEAKADQSWVTVTPSKGDGSGVVKVTVDGNDGDARSAKVTFCFMIDPAKAELTISQASGVPDDGIRKLTVAQFKALKDDAQTWYRLKGSIVSVVSYKFGDFYLQDNTGIIYVYGLAAKKDGNNEEFPTLGLKAGDEVTIIAHRKTYNGIDETDKAYYEKHTSGQYPGFSATTAQPKWLELPATKAKDGMVFLSHKAEKGGRNYSAFFNTGRRVSQWVCYPYVNKQGGSGRSDAYAFDPLVDEQYQANLSKSYQDRNKGGEEFIRGHMVPSNDRSGRDNYDVFLASNIMPQSSKLNEGLWSDIELKIHSDWSAKCDTLYVVTGTCTEGAPYTVKDTDGKVITVPSAIYKALLAHTKEGEYKALGAYFENKAASSGTFTKSLSISIDELEKLTGEDFFCNLSDDIESKVEAAKPADDGWWW